MNFDDDNPHSPDPMNPPVPWEAIEGRRSTEHLPNAVAAPVQNPVPANGGLPEDLRVPWGWTDLLLLVLLYVAGSIVISLPVLIVFMLAGVSRAQLTNSSSEQGLFVIASQTLLSVGVLAYLAAEMRVRYRSPFWRTIGWRPIETRHKSRGLVYLGIFCGGLLFSFLIQFTSAAFGTKAKLPIENLLQNQRNAIFFMLIAVTLAPVLEETMFRGYIFPVVARSFGVGAGIIATGTLFGLLHAIQLWGGWVQIGLLIVVGIFFTYVRSVTRTVVASYLLHLSYNSVPLLLYVIATHGFRQPPPGM